MAKRQVFFSFRYAYDVWRASQVRNMGKVSNDSTFSDNDWEEVKSKSDESIKKWIDEQMAKRSCVVLLIGEYTHPPLFPDVFYCQFINFPTLAARYVHWRRWAYASLRGATNQLPPP